MISSSEDVLKFINDFIAQTVVLICSACICFYFQNVVVFLEENAGIGGFDCSARFGSRCTDATTRRRCFSVLGQDETPPRGPCIWSLARAILRFLALWVQHKSLKKN